MNTLEKMTSTEVKKIAKDNLIIIPEKLRKDIKNLHANCIDGRLRSADDYTDAEIAIPGGKLGIVIAVLSALNQFGVSEKKKQKSIIIMQELLGFSYHTDEHQHDLVCGGCGHFKNAITHPAEYGLQETDLGLLHGYIHAGLSQDIQPDVLTGNHEERAVVLINGFSGTVRPTGEVFICNIDYYRWAIDLTLRKILDSLGIEYHPEDIERGMLCADGALQTTVNALAAHLPLYVFDVYPSGEIIIQD